MFPHTLITLEIDWFCIVAFFLWGICKQIDSGFWIRIVLIVLGWLVVNDTHRSVNCFVSVILCNCVHSNSFSKMTCYLWSQVNCSIVTLMPIRWHYTAASGQHRVCITEANKWFNRYFRECCVFLIWQNVMLTTLQVFLYARCLWKIAMYGSHMIDYLGSQVDLEPQGKLHLKVDLKWNPQGECWIRATGARRRCWMPAFSQLARRRCAQARARAAAAASSRRARASPGAAGPCAGACTRSTDTSSWPPSWDSPPSARTAASSSGV